MIAEENIPTDKLAELSDSQGKTLECIKGCIIKAIAPFKKAKKQPNIKPTLNEDNLTQILVGQIQVQLSAISNIFINSHYSDLFFGTKGIPDFYFYIPEEGKTHEPLFVVESKRLPAPNNKELREREYVIGNKNNGGIERYKKEKHGINMNECGMIGFIEDYSSSHWLKAINSWIQELANKDVNWNDDEQLEMKEDIIDYSYLVSIAHRKIGKGTVLLHHWWIIC